MDKSNKVKLTTPKNCKMGERSNRMNDEGRPLSRKQVKNVRGGGGKKS